MMDDSSNSRSSSDSVEVDLRMDQSGSPYMNGGSEVIVQFQDYKGTENGQPYLEIVEQPQQRGFRFRYECEGPSHGGLQGNKSEKFRKTVPSVKIRNYSGPAKLVVSLVTDENVPKPHAHKLVGRNCVNGECIVDVKPGTTQISLPNLCVQHVTRRKAAEVLQQRICEAMILEKKIQMGDLNASVSLLDEEIENVRIQATNQAKNMQLNVVRLCYRAYLLNARGQQCHLLQSVVSEPIYDSKAPGANALKICRMDKYSGCCTGNEEVFLLCEKVQKDDIQVRFVEQDEDGSILWENFGNFGPFDVHRQFAIVFKTPEYKDTNIDKPVNVMVMLQRKSDNESSDPKAFTYYPTSQDKEDIKRKRLKPLPFKRSHYDLDDQNLFQGGGGGKGGGGRGSSNSNGMHNGTLPDLDNLHLQPLGDDHLFSGGRLGGVGGPRPRLHASRRNMAGRHMNIPNQARGMPVQHPPTMMNQAANFANFSAVDFIKQESDLVYEEVQQISPGDPIAQLGGDPIAQLGGDPIAQLGGDPMSQLGANGATSQFLAGMTAGSPQAYTAASPQSGQTNLASPIHGAGSPHSMTSTVNAASPYSNETLSPQNYLAPSPQSTLGSSPSNLGSSHNVMELSRTSPVMQFGQQQVMTAIVNPIISESLPATATSMSNTPMTQITARSQLDMSNFPMTQMVQPIQQGVSQPVQVSSVTEQELDMDFILNSTIQQQQLQEEQFTYGMLHNQPVMDNKNPLDLYGRNYTGCGYEANMGGASLLSRNATGGMFGMEMIDRVGFDFVDGAPTSSAMDLSKAAPSTDVFRGKREMIDGKREVVQEEISASEVPVTNVMATKEEANAKEKVVSRETSVQADTVTTADAEVQTEMEQWMKLAEKTSHALQYYAATGDIRSLLMVQRYLMAVQDPDGDLPLHTSLINQRYEVFQNLLDVMVTLPDAYARINAYNFHNQTPLHLAVITDQPYAVDLLIRAGGDTTLVDRNGYTPAHLAVLYARDDCLRALLKYVRSETSPKAPFPELNTRCYDGFTAAHLAAQLENLTAMKLLVYGKADINLPDGKSGRTPLHHAVEADELSLAAYLILQAGANVNIKRFDGNTSLHIACGRNNVGMVALLMAGGADPEIENDDVVDEEGEVTVNDEEKEEADKPAGASSKGESDGDEVDGVEPEEEAPKSRRGLTPADFADCNDKILRVLSGEPYCSLTEDQDTDDQPTSHLSKKFQSLELSSAHESGIDSMNLYSTKGDIEKIDYPTRISLSQLLDPSKDGCDWLTLADKLGLRKVMEGCSGEHSPTRALLTYYEAGGGTVSSLSHALSEMKRDDAVLLLTSLESQALTEQTTVGDKTAFKDTNHDSGMGLESFTKSPSPVRRREMSS